MKRKYRSEAGHISFGLFAVLALIVVSAVGYEVYQSHHLTSYRGTLTGKECTKASGSCASYELKVSTPASKSSETYPLNLSSLSSHPIVGSKVTVQGTTSSSGQSAIDVKSITSTTNPSVSADATLTVEPVFVYPCTTQPCLSSLDFQFPYNYT